MTPLTTPPPRHAVASGEGGSQNSNPPSSPKSEDLSVETLIVLCGCSDGKTRAVAFDDNGKQAKQVHGYIRHIQGGGLKLHKEPVAIVQLAEPPPPPPIAEEPIARPPWYSRSFAACRAGASRVGGFIRGLSSVDRKSRIAVTDAQQRPGFQNRKC